LEIDSALSIISPHLCWFLSAVNPQGLTVLLITLAALLLLTFTISGAEVALFSLNEKDVNMLKTKQHAAARRIVNLLDEPKEVYASLLLGGTFINICIIVLSNYLINEYLPFRNMGFALELILKVVAISFILVFIGEIMPRVWATQNNLRFAYGTSFIISSLHLLLRRVSRWTVALADSIGRRVGANRSEAMNIRELDEAIDIRSDDEVSPEEKNILKGILKFGNISVRQIMRSRLDVNGVEYKSSFRELLRRLEELHYSRLPVYRGNLDEIAGIIYSKDIIPYLNQSDEFDWHTLIRQPYFVPESRLIEDLLKDFQQKKTHFAIVVDEFGGTAGIVTMEDILEEVIGEIRDEFDEEESINRRVDDHNYIFEGKTMIHDMCKTMRIPTDTFDAVRGESESLAGLILELAGEFPAANSVITSGDFDFTVLQAENTRIQQVKVTIREKQ